MKLKFIVAALGLIASAASHAALVSTSTLGGSSLTLNVWEDGSTAGTTPQSFMFNLGTTLTQFINTGSLSSSTMATLLSTDSTWTSFLGQSNMADLQWSVIASGAKPVAQVGHTTIFGTITNGQEDNATQTENNLLPKANTAVNSYYSNQGSADELVTGFGSNGSYLTQSQDSFGTNAWSNGNAIGATANAAKSAFVSANGPFGTTDFAFMPGTFTFAKTGDNFTLSYNVSAVPEAPASTMVLAGLGVMGLVARRRAKKSV